MSKFNDHCPMIPETLFSYCPWSQTCFWSFGMSFQVLKNLAKAKDTLFFSTATCGRIFGNKSMQPLVLVLDNLQASSALVFCPSRVLTFFRIFSFFSKSGPPSVKRLEVQTLGDGVTALGDVRGMVIGMIKRDPFAEKSPISSLAASRLTIA